MDDINTRLRAIFRPDDSKKASDVKNKKTRFVHYTTAAAAREIISKRQVWMRNTSCMNDYSEVLHGLNLIDELEKSEVGKEFYSTLETIRTGITKEVRKRFRSLTPRFLEGTYIASVSIHKKEENEHGRLSMWRAYGESAGIALVIKSDIFFNTSSIIGAYANPVSYVSDEKISNYFHEIIENINNNKDFLAKQDTETLVSQAFFTFKLLALCSKHPGFDEEKEWRIIYTPGLENSKRMESEIVEVRGIPQTVYKIPLENVPDEGLEGIEIPELLDRIIIGPTQYPIAMKDAFVKLLGEVGVQNPDSKVIVSDIPLRT